MSERVEKILKRFEHARTKKDTWDTVARDVYKYIYPNHDDFCGSRKNTQGTRTDIDVYDQTAEQALLERRAQLQGDLFPPMEQFVNLEPEAEIKDPRIRRAFDIWAEDAADKVYRAMVRSNFDTEISQALGDCIISTGIMCAFEGDDSCPLVFEAVSPFKVVPEEAADGMIKTVYRSIEMLPRIIDERWPQNGLSSESRQAENMPVDLLEACIFDSTRGIYEHCVIEKKRKEIIFEEEIRSSPWVVFRMDKATDEVMGRGPAYNCLGDIKVLNETKRLLLKNATLSINGMWQADDDGIMNPATITLGPGTIIPKAVGSAGLQPLQPSHNFDVSQLVIQDLQNTITQRIKGPQLPPVTDPTRTAYEIAERRADQLKIELPSSLRLLSECQYPIIMRVLAILMNPRFAASPYFIRPFSADLMGEGQETVLRPKPVSPIAMGQQIARKQTQLSAIAQAMQFDPQTAARLLKTIDFMYDYLKTSGVPEDMMEEPESVKQAMQAEQQQQAQMQQAQMAATAAIEGKKAGFDVEGMVGGFGGAM